MKVVVLLIFVVACLTSAWMLFSRHQILKCIADMEQADKQLTLYRTQEIGAQNEEEASLRRQQVEISQEIYTAAVGIYHCTLRKPIYRIPALLFGFRVVPINKVSS